MSINERITRLELEAQGGPPSERDRQHAAYMAEVEEFLSGDPVARAAVAFVAGAAKSATVDVVTMKAGRDFATRYRNFVRVKRGLPPLAPVAPWP